MSRSAHSLHAGHDQMVKSIRDILVQAFHGGARDRKVSIARPRDRDVIDIRKVPLSLRLAERERIDDLPFDVLPILAKWSRRKLDDASGSKLVADCLPRRSPKMMRFVHEEMRKL